MQLFAYVVFFSCIFSFNALKFDKSKVGILPSLRTCGFQYADDGRTNETDIKIHEFPWVVFIPVETRMPNPNANVRCTGTLIGRKYVMVNKPCLQFVLKTVHLGQFDTSQNVTCFDSECESVVEIDIEEKVVHPTSDIVLLRLAKRVTFTDYIQPICLPFENFAKSEIGNTVYSSGWGLTSLEGGFSKIKKKVREIIVNNEECEGDDSLICVKVQDDSISKPCNGDEGSPIMHHNGGQWVLDGILNWVFDSIIESCSIRKPAVGSRITEEVLQWIVDNVRS